MSPRGSWDPATAPLVLSMAGEQDQCLEQTGVCLGSKVQSSPESRTAPALLSANTPRLQCPGESMGTFGIFQDQALCLDPGGKNTLNDNQ